MVDIFEVRVLGGKLKVQAEDSGANIFTRFVRSFRVQVANFKPVFDNYDPYFKGEIRKNFQQQGRPRRWAELATSTQRDRERQGFGATRPILIRSGALFRGFRSNAKRREYSIGNRMFYFPYHQLGTANIPARPMVVVLRGHREEFARLAREHLGID